MIARIQPRQNGKRRVFIDEDLPTPGRVRGSLAGALATHAEPMPAVERIDNYERQNGNVNRRLTARQIRRLRKKARRS